MLSRRTIGNLPPKKGKVKLPIFCGNGELVIPIYDEDHGTPYRNTLLSSIPYMGITGQLPCFLHGNGNLPLR